MKQKNKTYKFRAKLWKYEGKAAWHFVSLPKLLSKEIKKNHSKNAAAWGSIRVEVKINKTSWQTSIFSDSKRGSFLLPVKASIRNALKLTVSKTFNLQIKINLEESLFDD